MADAGSEIARAFTEIAMEDAEERYRQQYRAAIRVLRTIPSGTTHNDLTQEQREAWVLHNEAIAWVQQRMGS